MDERIWALYGVGLDEFVGARNALAKQLKSDGDAEAAERVRALRKPSVPAWAINQLSRREPDKIQALVAIGARLADAHASVVAGGEAAALHEARAAERVAVANLVDDAERVLAEAGFAPSNDRRERVADTLFAIAADQEARTEVVEGRLVAERQRVGFVEQLGAVPIPRTAKASPAPAGDPAILRSEAEAGVARAMEARALADRLSEDERTAEREAEQARTRANDVRRRAERARHDADRAEREAQELAQRLSESGADILGPAPGG